MTSPQSHQLWKPFSFLMVRMQTFAFWSDLLGIMAENVSSDLTFAHLKDMPVCLAGIVANAMTWTGQE
ncbi:hypothetical protein ACIP6T_17275 [Pantoea sp. NPDC088449]|uniref:hypothetical protein n=1 Tax=unclassified Pantoea TaxID=2630326 RepID=UPI0031F49AE3